VNFAGSVVLVTGASRGIGSAIARQFAALGATVAVHYASNAAAADQTLSSLRAGSHFAVRADVAKPDEAAALVDEVVARAGALHVLVNNAGIYEQASVLDAGYGDWQSSWTRTLAINLLGPANVTYCAVGQMLKQGRGRIVNVSSRGAFRGEVTAPAYAASKAGLNAFGQSLALALAPHGIFVGTVAPGFVETDMAAEILAGPEGDAIRRQSPLNRVARPEEVAHAVAFLASDGAEFTTGTIVDVNGASYLRS
jgi:NAD(P)-dependent dehydrogenase (short-subunit alcohol dehydrogenase family)